MPYFITDKSPDCSGWATIKEDGEVLGCHETKEDAIAQMVALSIAEDMEPGGERALPEELNVGDYVMWFNGDNLLQGQIKEIELLDLQKSNRLLCHLSKLQRHLQIFAAPTSPPAVAHRHRL